MHRKILFKSLSVLATSAAAIVAIASLKSSPVTVAAQVYETRGSLQVLDPSGKPRGNCPLKHKNKEAQPGADEAKFIRDGKAEIQIWLTDKSPETLAKLKALGFEVVLDPKTAKLVIGRLPIEKLDALAELKFIRYIAPQVANH